MSDQLQDDPTDYRGWYSLHNALVIGVYLELMSRGDEELAHAWIDSDVVRKKGKMPLRISGPFSVNPRPVYELVLRPHSDLTHQVLSVRIDDLRAVVAEYSSYVGDEELEFCANAWISLRDTIYPSTEDRVDELKALLQEGNSRCHQLLVELEDIEQEHGPLLWGWGQKWGQRIQLLGVSTSDPEVIGRTTKWLREVSRALWDAGKRELETGEINNISDAVKVPGPGLLSRASGATPVRSRPWKLGLIVPGGPHASGDVQALQKDPRIECSARTVYRNSSSFAAEMSSAVRDMQVGRDALVIAFGGGDASAMKMVIDAVKPHLEELNIPCWVAVGHAANRMTVENNMVRVCNTPSDARSLFLAETVDYERKLALILSQSLGEIHGTHHVAGSSGTVSARLASLEAETSAARELHMQTP